MGQQESKLEGENIMQSLHRIQGDIKSGTLTDKEFDKINNILKGYSRKVNRNRNLSLSRKDDIKNLIDTTFKDLDALKRKRDSKNSLRSTNNYVKSIEEDVNNIRQDIRTQPLQKADFERFHSQLVAYSKLLSTNKKNSSKSKDIQELISTVVKELHSKQSKVELSGTSPPLRQPKKADSSPGKFEDIGNKLEVLKTDIQAVETHKDKSRLGFLSNSVKVLMQELQLIDVANQSVDEEKKQLLLKNLQQMTRNIDEIKRQGPEEGNMKYQVEFEIKQKRASVFRELEDVYNGIVALGRNINLQNFQAYKKSLPIYKEKLDAVEELDEDIRTRKSEISREILKVKNFFIELEIEQLKQGERRHFQYKIDLDKFTGTTESEAYKNHRQNLIQLRDKVSKINVSFENEEQKKYDLFNIENNIRLLDYKAKENEKKLKGPKDDVVLRNKTYQNLANDLVETAKKLPNTKEDLQKISSLIDETQRIIEQKLSVLKYANELQMVSLEQKQTPLPLFTHKHVEPKSEKLSPNQLQSPQDFLSSPMSAVRTLMPATPKTPEAYKPSVLDHQQETNNFFVVQKNYLKSTPIIQTDRPPITPKPVQAHLNNAKNKNNLFQTRHDPHDINYNLSKFEEVKQVKRDFWESKSKKPTEIQENVEGMMKTRTTDFAARKINKNDTLKSTKFYGFKEKDLFGNSKNVEDARRWQPYHPDVQPRFQEKLENNFKRSGSLENLDKGLSTNKNIPTLNASQVSEQSKLISQEQISMVLAKHNIDTTERIVTDSKPKKINNDAEIHAKNQGLMTNYERLKDYEKNTENEKQSTVKLNEGEEHSQQVTETLLETKKEKPLQILDVHEYFRDGLDLSSLDSLPPIEKMNKISTYARTFEAQVKEFKEEKYSLEYFVLDEKLMQLIEKLDKIKCQADEELTKKKIEIIGYIKKLHAILDSNSEAKHSTEKTEPKVTDKNYFKGPTLLKSGEINSNAETYTENRNVFVNHEKQRAHEKNTKSEKLSGGEGHGQQVTKTLPETTNNEPLQILDVHEYFRNGLDLKSLDSLPPREIMNKISTYARTFETQVKEFKEEKYSLEYFVLDEKLMQLIEKLDKIKCQADEELTKKKIEIIGYIKKLHAILDSNSEAKHSTETTKPKVTDKNYLKRPTVLKSDEIDSNEKTYTENRNVFIDHEKQRAHEKNAKSEKLSGREGHGQQVTKTLPETTNNEPLQILDVHEYFRNGLDLKSLDSLPPREIMNKISTYARTFETQVKEFKEEKYSLEYFVLDEKLMQLIEKLDKIKCQADEELTKKKIEIIGYIKKLHAILDSNSEAKHSTETTKPKETDKNYLKEPTLLKSGEINSNAETYTENRNVFANHEKQRAHEENTKSEKLSGGEGHGQQVTKTLPETTNNEPLQILDVHEYFRNGLDLKSLDSLPPREIMNKISTYARTFETQVKEFKEEKYSLEYFVLDEKLMQLIEKLDKIKCQADEELTKKKIEVIGYIKKLHAILDSNSEAKHSTETTKPKVTDKNYLKGPTPPKSGEINSNAETYTENRNVFANHEKQRAHEENTKSKKLGGGEGHGQQVTKTLPETTNNEPLQILDVHEYFRNGLDLKSLDSLPPREIMNKISTYARTFETQVKEFKEEKYSLEYFVLDEKLMQLIEKLDKIKCQADEELTKKKIEIIGYIKKLHAILDSNSEAKHSTETTKPKETDKNYLKEPTLLKSGEINSNAETYTENRIVFTNHGKQTAHEKNSKSEKLSAGEGHGQQIIKTLPETTNNEPLQILDVHEYFRDGLDLNSLDSLPPREKMDKISTYARTFEAQVKEFKEEKFSLEYFVLDEKLMQLIEKLDKIKCEADAELTKKKIEVIGYIKKLHAILDSCAK